jgi:serine/threonine-protein kinase
MEQTKKLMIGKYEIISQLVKGGMGATYKAKHPILERYVVLKKLLLKGSKIFISRFKREARLMIDFNNDYIVSVYDIFKEGSSYYIAIEYVDGVSLSDLIRRERYLTNEASLLIFYEVCKALKYVHDKNIVHRDIKPGNILISKEGEVKLIDFGIATSDDEVDDGLTKEGMTLGTPSYMAPEQIKDSKNVDKRADIYSMGVMLYEMVTGKTPYPGNFSPETIVQIQKGKYKAPQKLNPHVHPVIRQIIKKTMHVKKSRRFQDINDVFRLLHKYIKQRDPDFLRETIKNALNNKDVRHIYKYAPSYLRVIAKTVLALGAVAAAVTYLYIQGFHYEFLVNQDYGALMLAARVNKNFKEPKELFIEGELYKESRELPEKIKEVTVNFSWQKELDNKTYHVLQSSKIYLKAGYYRVMINIEGRQYWQSFFLRPRSLQKQSEASAKAQLISLTYNPEIRQSFAIRPRIIDSNSGRDITANSQFLIKWGGKYAELDETLVEQLKTGILYTFKAARDMYYPQHYYFALKPFQEVAELDIYLVPLPGTLVLTSTSNSLKVNLNNASYYLSGGLERSLQPLTYLQKGREQKLILAPGEYNLTIERSKTASRTIKIDIKSGETVNVKADYGEKDKNFIIAIN